MGSDDTTTSRKVETSSTIGLKRQRSRCTDTLGGQRSTHGSRGTDDAVQSLKKRCATTSNDEDENESDSDDCSDGDSDSGNWVAL